MLAYRISLGALIVAILLSVVIESWTHHSRAEGTHTVHILAEDATVPDGATVIYLAEPDWSSITSLQEEELYLVLPVPGSADSVTLTGAAITLASGDPTDTLAVGGTGTILGLDVGLQAVVQRTAGTGGNSATYTYSLGAKLAPAEDGTLDLSALNPQWVFPSGALPFDDIYLVLSTGDQTGLPPEVQDFYSMVNLAEFQDGTVIPAGISFGGQVDLALVIGADAAESLTDPTSGTAPTLTIEGFLTADLSFFPDDPETPPIANPGFDLQATLSIHKDAPINNWVAPRGDWHLGLSWLPTADTTDADDTFEFVVTLGGTVGFKLAGLPEELTIEGDFSYSEGNIETNWALKAENWNDAFGADFLDISVLMITLSLSRVDGDVDVSASAEGKFEIGGLEFEIFVSIASADPEPAATLRVELLTPVTLQDVLEALPGGLLDDVELPEGIGNNSIGPGTIEFSVTGSGKVTVGAVAEVTAEVFGFQLPFELMLTGTFGGSTSYAALGLKLLPGATLGNIIQEPLAVDFPLSPPVTGGQEASGGFAFVFSTGTIEFDSANLPECVESWFRPLFGGDLSGSALSGGVGVVGAATLPEPLAGFVSQMGMDPSVRLHGSLSFNPIAVDLGMALRLRQGFLPDFIAAVELELSLGFEATPTPALVFALEGSMDLKFKQGMDAGLASQLQGLGLNLPAALPVAEGDSCPRGGSSLPTEELDPDDEEIVVTRYYCYDKLRLFIGTELEVTAVPLEVSLRAFAGMVTQNTDSEATWSPLGIEEIGIGSLGAVVEISFTAAPPSLNLKLGFYGDVTLFDYDVSAGIKLGASVVTAPTPIGIAVTPNFDGLRISFPDGFETNGVIDLANVVAGAVGAPAVPYPDPATFPNIALKNLYLSISPVGAPDVCIEQGLILRGDLYVNPPADLDLEGGPPCDPTADPPVGYTTNPDETCEQMQDEGCVAGVLFSLTADGLIAEGFLAEFDLGPFQFDETAVRLALSLDEQSLSLSGGLTVESIGSGSVAVSLGLTEMSFEGDIQVFGAFQAYIEGSAALDLTDPTFQLRGFIRQEIGAAINDALAPLFRPVGATLLVLNDGMQTFRDPDATFDDVVITLLESPQTLAEAGVTVPPWLTVLSTTVADALDSVAVSNGGDGVLTQIVSAVLTGAEIHITDGVQGSWTSPYCAFYFLKNKPRTAANCYLFKPGLFGAPHGIFVPPYCASVPPLPGIVIDGTCYAIPPITLHLPGLCTILPVDAFGTASKDYEDPTGNVVLSKGAPITCSAWGLKIAASQLFDQALVTLLDLDAPDSPTAAVDALQDDIQAFAVALLNDEATIIDLPCAAFDVSLGSAGGPVVKNAFQVTLHVVVFDKDIYLNVLWDFTKTPAENALALEDDLYDALFGSGGEPGLCAAPPVSSSVDTVGGETEAPIGILTITSLTATSVTEGGTTTLVGEFSDPSYQDGDVFTADIAWGDGSVSDDVPVTGGATGSFSISHTYADDPPGTTSPVTNIAVALLNQRTGGATRTTKVDVLNADPVVSLDTAGLGTILEGQSISVSGSYTDVGVLDTHTVRVAWGDGQATDVTPVGGSFNATHRFVDDIDLSGPVTNSTEFSIVVTVTDDDGGEGTAGTTVTVANVPPEVTSSFTTTETAEGSEATITGTFTDPGEVDQHKVVVAWGDGVVEWVGLTQGQRTFSVSHTFADDHPTGTPSDLVVAEVTVEDKDMEAGNSWPEITVANVPPSNIQLGLLQASSPEGYVVAVEVVFDDPGAADTHEIVIDWGDGTEPDTVQVEPEPPEEEGDSPSPIRFVPFTHRYLDDNPSGDPANTYFIDVTITDDDTGVVSGVSRALLYTPDGPVAHDVKGIDVLNLDPVAGEPSVVTQTVQYSDPIQDVVLTVTDVAGYDFNPETVTLSTSFDVVTLDPSDPGGAGIAGVPLGMAVVSQGCVDVPGDESSPVVGPRVACQWKVFGIAAVAPGTYTFEAVFTDDDGGTGSTTFEVVVEAEDARSYYTGPTFAATVSATNGTATIELRTSVRDITAEPQPTDPPGHWDSYAGDITHAIVDFVDRTTGQVLCTAPVERLFLTGAPSVGTASCAWEVTLNSATEGTAFTVGTVVRGWYTRNVGAEDTVVVVARPLDNFITGGGYIDYRDAADNLSAGRYAADDGTIANFGFNVKFNNKGTNLQGRATVIVRSGGRVYQFKTNRLDSLGIVDTGSGPRTAQFEGRANLTDVTDPANPIPMGGNLRIQMDMTDVDEPADVDSISWTVYNSDGSELLLASRWDGVQTIEQTAQGNLVVHGNGGR